MIREHKYTALRIVVSFISLTLVACSSNSSEQNESAFRVDFQNCENITATFSDGRVVTPIFYRKVDEEWVSLDFVLARKNGNTSINDDARISHNEFVDLVGQVLADKACKNEIPLKAINYKLWLVEEHWKTTINASAQSELLAFKKSRFHDDICNVILPQGYNCSKTNQMSISVYYEKNTTSKLDSKNLKLDNANLRKNSTISINLE